MELPNRITLVLGDWSHDGHNMTSNFIIDSNLTSKEVESAYKRGASKCGLDLRANVCSDYEDSSISAEDFKKLADAGYDRGDFGKVDPDDDDPPGDPLKVGIDYVDHDEFLRMWLFIVKLGEPSFECKEIRSYDVTVNIGGYGLLCP